MRSAEADKASSRTGSVRSFVRNATCNCIDIKISVRKCQKATYLDNLLFRRLYQESSIIPGFCK